MSKKRIQYTISYDHNAKKLSDFDITPCLDLPELMLKIQEYCIKMSYQFDVETMAFMVMFTDYFCRANILKAHLKEKMRETHYIIRTTKKVRETLEKYRKKEPFLDQIIQYEYTGKIKPRKQPYRLTDEIIQSIFDNSPQFSVLYSHFYFHKLPSLAKINEFVKHMDELINETYKLSANKTARLITFILSLTSFSRSQRTIANIISKNVTNLK